MPIFPYLIALAPRGIIGVRGHRVLRGAVHMGKEQRGKERGFRSKVIDQGKGYRVRGLGGWETAGYAISGPSESPPREWGCRQYWVAFEGFITFRQR